ncbi:hypothetical protein C8Q80DRAFT_147043 [Daedaleopsis nitida]|nr:hypothetical protein C8Q80DRAFT_147043 [Daedaleopsis nitida]
MPTKCPRRLCMCFRDRRVGPYEPTERRLDLAGLRRHLRGSRTEIWNDDRRCASCTGSPVADFARLLRLPEAVACTCGPISPPPSFVRSPQAYLLSSLIREMHVPSRHMQSNRVVDTYPHQRWWTLGT